MSEKTVINTIEELVAYVMRNPESTQRYKFSCSNRHVWVDPEEGAVYEKLERPEYVSEYRDDGKPDWEMRLAIYKNEDAIYRAQRPAERMVEIGYLEYNVSNWLTYGFELSPELTAKVKAVWTMKPSYKGSSYMRPSGSITLASLLKRLGLTDAGKQIENAKAAQKEQERKNHRRHVRKEISKAAAELKKLIDANQDCLMFPEDCMGIDELAALDVEA